MKNENTRVRGVVSYVLTDADGVVKDERTIQNQIQNLGLSSISARLIGTSVGAFDAIAIGTGSGQAVGDTTLSAEITTDGGGRRSGVDVTRTQETTTVTDDTAQFFTTFSFTGAHAITEAGIFNAASAGVMLAYQDFSVINVSSGDNLQITWRVSFS